MTSHLAGMSKSQLYDIMSQMKALIEQNQQQARQILVANPPLTKALFQAQIMLGMVQPPQVMPNIQQSVPQQPQQSAMAGPQPSLQAPPNQGPLGSQNVTRQTQSLQAPITTPASQPPVTQSAPLHSLQAQGAQHSQSQLSAQMPMTFPQPTHVHNIPLHSAPQPSISGPQASGSSSHAAQQSLQSSSGVLPLQPLLPQFPRPPMQSFSHQVHPQHGFQPSSVPQQLHSQPMYHSGINPPTSIGVPSFPQGQPQLLSHPPPPPPQVYQTSSHGGVEQSSQGGSGAPWLPGPSESGVGGGQLPPPPPIMAGQMQMPRQQLQPDVEKALQQVMNLPPEQINLLPPEQRQQILQLQQWFR
ncbi:cleavage stimulating factor 64 isoform X2 [Amborella trichopoda]|nr:cleavage stimulating factor 64 isoform X2 [Amborella trichopoda]|eukprot:XP_011622581.1 cleavage stimulating factor 64 isoform X2 [Amborella trichopoda]